MCHCHFYPVLMVAIDSPGSVVGRRTRESHLTRQRMHRPSSDGWREKKRKRKKKKSLKNERKKLERESGSFHRCRQSFSNRGNDDCSSSESIENFTWGEISFSFRVTRKLPNDRCKKRGRDHVVDLSHLENNFANYVRTVTSPRIEDVQPLAV